MKDKDTAFRIAGVVSSHLSFIAGFALIYWWLSSTGVPEFERLFWGAVALFGGFCFAGYFLMKRFRQARRELVGRIEELEKRRR